MAPSSLRKKCLKLRRATFFIISALLCLALQDWTYRRHLSELHDRFDQLEAVSRNVPMQEISSPLDLGGASNLRRPIAKAKNDERAPWLQAHSSQPHQRRLQMFANIASYDSATAGSGCVDVSLANASISISMETKTCNSHRCPPCWIASEGHATHKLALLNCSTGMISEQMNMGSLSAQPSFQTAMLGITFVNIDSNPFIVSDGSQDHTVDPHTSAVAHCHTGGFNELFWLAPSAGGTGGATSSNYSRVANATVTSGTFFEALYMAGESWMGVDSNSMYMTRTLGPAPQVVVGNIWVMGGKELRYFQMSESGGILSPSVSEGHTIADSPIDIKSCPYSDNGDLVVCGKSMQNFIGCYAHTATANSGNPGFSTFFKVFGEMTVASLFRIQPYAIGATGAGSMLACYTQGGNGTWCGKIIISTGMFQEDTNLKQFSANDMGQFDLESVSYADKKLLGCGKYSDTGMFFVVCKVITLEIGSAGVDEPYFGVGNSPTDPAGPTIQDYNGIRLTKLNAGGDEVVMCVFKKISGPPAGRMDCSVAYIAGTDVFFGTVMTLATAWQSNMYGKDMAGVYLMDGFAAVWVKTSTGDDQPESDLWEIIVLQHDYQGGSLTKIGKLDREFTMVSSLSMELFSETWESNRQGQVLVCNAATPESPYGKGCFMMTITLR